MVAALRKALGERLRAFMEVGDPGLMLDGQGLLDAVALARATTSWQDGVEALHINDVHLLAWFHWCRYVAHDRDPDGRPVSPVDDLEACLRLFAALVTVEPEEVPHGVRRHFADSGTSGGLSRETAEGFVALTEMAEVGLAAARARQDPEAYAVTAELVRRGLGVLPYGHPSREHLQVALADAYRERYEISGEPRDLARAIAWLRGALGAVSPAAATFAGRVAALDDLTWRQFRDTGTDTDLETALGVRRLRAAVAEGDEQRQTARLFLGEALLRRAQRRYAQADIDEAVEHLRYVVATAGDHPRRVLPLSCLGAALLLRDGRTRSSADVDEAVAVCEAALAAAPQDFDQRGELLINLAAGYLRRHLRSGDLADLSLALMRAQEALDVVPEGHAARVQVLTVAADAFLALAERGGPGQENQRDAGVQYLLEAARTEKPGEDQAQRLARMAQALARVHRATGERAALDHGIDAWRRVLAVLSEHDQDFTTTVAQFATALRERYDRDGDVADLDLAISGFRLVASAEPDFPFAAFTLGSALERRYRVNGDLADAREAIDVWRAVAGAERAGVDRMPSGRAWGELATELGEAGSGLAGYEIAVELLPLEAWRGLDRADRELILGTWTRLGADAAACAIEAGRPERGLELLEASRSVLWAQRDQVRADVGAVAATHPGLAARLTRLRDEYEQDGDPATVRAFGDRIVWDLGLAERRRRRAQEWDAAVAEIRALPGQAGFLAPPDFETLVAGATGGPVLVVNGSRHRCDVLAVTPAGVRVVPLADAPLTEVRSRAAAYTHEMVEYQTGRRGLAARVRLERHVSGLLSWLWDAVTGPALDALGYLGPPRDGTPWPRVWWSPTDAFAALPLHAAGRANSTVDAVPERVMSSYAPTVRSLAASGTAGGPTGPRRLLVVAVPEAAGLPPLPHVLREAAVLRGLFPDRHTALVGPDATAERVREQLPRHDWIHLACHGGQLGDDPVMGTLHLYSGRLTVTELGWTDLRATQFAYLSACRTATGSVGLLDEAIHPAAALRIAGCQHVVAAMWAVDDDAAVEVVSEVYRNLAAADRPAGSGIAEVLHRTVRRMRAVDPHAPTRWTPFIHLGP